jgi:hypothetical protein
VTDQREDVDGLRLAAAQSGLELEPVARRQCQSKVTGERDTVKIKVRTTRIGYDVSITARPVEPFDGTRRRYDHSLSIASDDHARAATACRTGRSTDRSSGSAAK